MAIRDLMNGKQNALTTWHQEHRVEGQNGRTIDLAVFNGSIQYANGEFAVFAGVEAIEISDVAEPFAGNIIVLLKDGSVSHQSFDAELTFRDGPSRIGGVGTWQFLTGTGRFLGLRGGGRLDWTLEDEVWRADFSAEAGVGIAITESA